MQKLSNQKDDYDEVDSLYKDLIHDLESKGYNILNGSDSKTDFGHSKYFYVNYQNKSSENYGNGLKVRVSDHTVMNRDRMLNEIHFRTKDLNNYMNDRSMFIIDKYFKPELFKKITEKENYTEELRVGGNEYNPETDTIIENLGKSKRGNDSYKVLRKKYRLVDYYIDSRNNKKYKYSEGGLIAPNGKPSNLTPEQYKLVRTPEFKAWFGDWENDPENSSKVVDSNGEPLVVYHGTANIDYFDTKKNQGEIIFNNNPKESLQRRTKRGEIYFSSNNLIAQEFSTIQKTNDENNPIVYVENENEYSVYKRFVDGKWMYLKRDNWLTVKNVDE
jgi:hypothetical protein